MMTDPAEKYTWPMSNAELSLVLGIKEGTLRQHQRNHKIDLVEGTDYWGADLSVAYAPTLMTVWSRQGAIKLAHYCRRSVKASAFLKEMGVTNVFVTYPEGRFLEIIESAMSGYSECLRQYAVGPYRLILPQGFANC
jgi:hypothetical protein